MLLSYVLSLRLTPATAAPAYGHAHANKRTLRRNREHSTSQRFASGPFTDSIRYRYGTHARHAVFIMLSAKPSSGKLTATPSGHAIEGTFRRSHGDSTKRRSASGPYADNVDYRHVSGALARHAGYTPYAASSCAVTRSSSR
ncbi:hypothetical protein ACG7TL_002179 [Trametes sanguinea]